MLKSRNLFAKCMGKRMFTSVNELRLELFLQKYKTKNGNEAIPCVKKWIAVFFHLVFEI